MEKGKKSRTDGSTGGPYTWRPVSLWIQDQDMGNTDPLQSEHCLGRRAITHLGVSCQERRSPLKKLRVGSGVLLVTVRLKLSFLAFWTRGIGIGDKGVRWATRSRVWDDWVQRLRDLRFVTLEWDRAATYGGTPCFRVNCLSHGLSFTIDNNLCQGVLYDTH